MTFAYYSFQGEDVYTETLAGKNPQWNFQQTHEISMVELIDLANAGPLEVALFDDSNSSLESANNLLGVAKLNLGELVKNDSAKFLVKIMGERELEVG